MIISASRRTDIPAFYSDWFFQRLDEGCFFVRNPMNPRQVSRVSFTKEEIEGIVFWTKNPKNLIPKLNRLGSIPYYFQFTLTPYGRDLEPGLDKDQVVKTFKELSGMIGKKRIVWRYDPIVISPLMDANYHFSQFEALAEELGSFTEKCIVSFVDFYAKARKKLETIGAVDPSLEEKLAILRKLIQIAKANGLGIEVCCEAVLLGEIQVTRARCVDATLLGEIAGENLAAEKDPNQRPECRCHVSVDVGAYDTCLWGCVYCYANGSAAQVQKKVKNYRQDSPLLCSEIGALDVITERAVKPLKPRTRSLFLE